MDINEEWNNFMHRVTEISGIVAGLSSKDREASQNAKLLADKYLKDSSDTITDVEANIQMKVICDRTIINEKACHKKERPANSNEMDPETFMQEVGRDADNRAADKKIRRERADTFKTRAQKAFRRGEFELALSCYNKAIEQIRDSCVLYTSRALTCIKLGKFEKVLGDCEWALRCNDNSFKAQLYRARAHQELENMEEYDKCYGELMKLFPQHADLIEQFLTKETTKEIDNDC